MTNDMKRLVIDTDTGADDAVALLMALAHPTATVEAVTTVAGNVPLVQATRNACCTLRVAGHADVPVYVGADRPLTRPLETATDVHGSDGLGDSNQPDPQIEVQAEHAVDALLRLSRQNPGELTLITLGPLTNIALALAIDPAFLTRFDHTVIMGGAPDVVGNITDMAEFNIWVDPEAALRVFESPGNKTMVGWNVAMASALVSVEQRQQMAATGTACGQFAHDVTAVVEAFCHEELGLPFFSLPDPIAVAIALDPAISTRSQPIGVRVGVGEARGVTFPTYLTPDFEPTTIVWEADAQAFATQMFTALSALR